MVNSFPCLFACFLVLVCLKKKKTPPEIRFTEEDRDVRELAGYHGQMSKNEISIVFSTGISGCFELFTNSLNLEYLFISSVLVQTINSPDSLTKELQFYGRQMHCGSIYCFAYGSTLGLHPEIHFELKTEFSDFCFTTFHKLEPWATSGFYFKSLPQQACGKMPGRNSG